MVIADLHIHSHYSRATSRDCTPERLDLWARRKGIALVGTGDFTHPGWRQELRETLKPMGNGFYALKEERRLADSAAVDLTRPQFVITGEISSIYKKHGRVRKVHSLILLPGLEQAELVAQRLEGIGNLHSDGRPILGLDCRDLLEILLELCPEAIYVPAHIWTPHFSLFGAFSGFDTVEECFEDLSCQIHAMETGLSSDPAMNRRVSTLDRYQLISNSDAHSPSKLGREANLLTGELSYPALKKALETGEGLAGTLEFFPEEGKYHYDGHRKCGICLSPAETESYGGICPVCGRKLVVGVSHRVEQLADRPAGEKSGWPVGFESLVPLPELIGASLGCSPASAKTGRLYQDMLRRLGPEFPILRQVPLEEIRRVAGELVAEGIGRLRRGEVDWRPGFDGEYGKLRLFTYGEIQRLSGQTSLFGVQEDSPDRAEKPRPVLEKANPNPKEPALEEHREPVWNERQRQAVEAVGRAIVVKAGPGTGKTGTLAARILHLLETRRVGPSRVTAVTFTNQAAKELRERIERQVGKAPAQKLQIGSFHSIARKRLEESGLEFSVAGEPEALALAEELRTEFGLKQTAARLLAQISAAQTGTGGPELELERPVVEAYQRRLREWGALDFDGILLEALRLAREEDKTQEPGPFSYLLVDEFQDIDPLQYQLVLAWNQGGRELFAIGDQDQAIYGFRGADSRCFQRLAEDFPGLRSIVLEENYRSTPQILAAASRVIARNPGGRESLRTHRAAGPPVRVVAAESKRAEAIFVAKEVNRLAGGVGMLEAQELSSEREGVRGLEDIAVLYRTHRQAALLEECFRREGIPYVAAGREDFLAEGAAQEAVCFFKALLRPGDRLAARTAQALLTRADSGRYEELAERYAARAKRQRPQKLLEDWARDRGLEQDPAVEKLCRTAVFYQRMAELLEALETGAESDLKRCGGKRYTAGAVSLMTLHGAKGLEFPVVMIYGAKKGLLPFAGGRAAWEEEERRLFYVGLTRARDELILTTSPEPSPFLEDLPPELAVRETARPVREIDPGRQLDLFEMLR